MSLPEDFESSLYLAPYTSKKRGVTMNLVLHGFLTDDFVSSLYLAPYTLKKRSVTMMKSCKSIPNEFAREGKCLQIDSQWRFRMDLPVEKIPSVDLDHQQMRFWWGR